MGSINQRLGEKGQKALRIGKKVAVGAAILGSAVLGVKAVRDRKKESRGDVLHPEGVITEPYAPPKEASPEGTAKAQEDERVKQILAGEQGLHKTAPPIAPREAPKSRDIEEIIAQPSVGVKPKVAGEVLEEVGKAVGGKKKKGEALMSAVGVIGNGALFGNQVESSEEKRKKLEAEAKKGKVVYTEKPSDKLERDMKKAEEEDRKRREAGLKEAEKRRKKNQKEAEKKQKKAEKKATRKG